MNALVMSGAANFGAMQAGAVEAIYQAGFKPDLIAGTSAGALNAIFLGAHSGLEGVQRLQELWQQAGPEQVGVPTTFSALRGLLSRREGLVSSQPLAQFLTTRLPPYDTFGELYRQQGICVYTTAVSIEAGSLRVFGDADGDRLLDGAMASTAVPPYYPPWRVDGQRYLDGGVLTKLPLEVACMRGATRIVALNISNAMGSRQTAQGVLGISGYSVTLMVEMMAKAEIERVKANGIQLWMLEMEAPADIPFWEYTQSERLIELGRQLATQSLAERPLKFESPLSWKIRGWLQRPGYRA